MNTELPQNRNPKGFGSRENGQAKRNPNGRSAPSSNLMGTKERIPDTPDTGRAKPDAWATADLRDAYGRDSHNRVLAPPNPPNGRTRYARNCVNVQRLTAVSQVTGSRKGPARCRSAKKAAA